MEDVPVRSKSRLLEREEFEKDFYPLKWKTALTWERDGIVRVIRIGRRCFLDREDLEKLVAEGGRRFANGWRRAPRGS